MAIKAILFDLDGTLLPMDTDVFIMKYMGQLSAYLNRVLNIENGQELLYTGVMHQFNHDPELTNREAFFVPVTKALGMPAETLEELIMPYYLTEYDELKQYTGTNPLAAVAIQTALDKGLEVHIATNPVFPRLAAWKRVTWAGIDDDMYKELTTYEHYHFAKPKKEYYFEVLKRCNLAPEECVMVGNDVEDDLCCADLGMQTFWLDDYPINAKNLTPQYNGRGGYEELIAFIKAL